ncbi:MAG: FAD-dependent oxidoreductase [Pseudomonadota bacterium]
MTRTDPESYEVDTLVIGAGVVGLAAARALALRGRQVTVLERNAGIGMETSSRNSEVIHAGIFYAPGSNKAALCVEGKQRLYAFCAEAGVPHRRTGKIVAAWEASQQGTLDRVLRLAEAAGVGDLQVLERSDLARLEPALNATAGVLSPSTGIVDSHALMLALLGAAEAGGPDGGGAELITNAPVTSGEVLGDGRIALTVGTDPPVRLVARHLVNAAGLWAQATARAIEGVPRASIPDLCLAKGSYFTLSGRVPFSHLIYPAPPGDGSLGVHLTLDLAGGARFGPDIEPLEHSDPDAVDYAVDPGRAGAFEAAVRHWWPDLPEGALEPGYAGCRPKLAFGNAGDVAFRIDGPARHGLAGHVMCYGLESPALTASMAIAERIADEICT